MLRWIAMVALVISGLASSVYALKSKTIKLTLAASLVTVHNLRDRAGLVNPVSI